MQLPEPTGAKLPAAQAAHRELPVLAKWPAAHNVHTPALAGANEPAAHNSVVAPPSHELPAGQGLHSRLTARVGAAVSYSAAAQTRTPAQRLPSTDPENVLPATQEAHLRSVEAVPSITLPLPTPHVRHVVHVAAPAKEKLPRVHFVQVAEPLDAKVPASQISHNALPASE